MLDPVTSPRTYIFREPYSRRMSAAIAFPPVSRCDP
jgi:hypothetical protein